jgi:hypothetical protein
MRDRHLAFVAARRALFCFALIGCGAEMSDPAGGAMATSPTGAPSPATVAGSSGAPAGMTQPPGTPATPSSATPGQGVVTTPMGSPVAPPPAAAQGVTYHKDIRPLIESSCVECHSGNPEFLIAPMPLATFAEVMPYGESVVLKVMSGEMPPWPAAADCREIADNRSLPPETRALFEQWKAAGFPEGNAADYVEPPKRGADALGEPDLILNMAAPYMPRTNDEYTCFGLADDSGRIYSFPENKYMLAVQVLPGVPSEVHHVQLHRQTGAPAAGPSGCGASAENMFSWRPGSTPLVYPDQSAALIPTNAGFTIQVHYNAQSTDGYKPDQTRVAFWFMKEGTPKNLVTREGVFAGVSIPPGQKEVTSNGGASFGAGASIIGVTPHAHMLATKMSARATMGGQEQCLVNVPEWDFHWQLDYMFKEPIVVDGSMQVSTQCVWDNSAENQPTINGMQLQPRQVAFGEASLDEMCLHYIWVSRPFR